MFVHVVALVFLSISIIISLTLFVIECMHQRKVATDPSAKQLNTTVNNSSLKYYSLLAIIFGPLASLAAICSKIPVICVWPMYSICVQFWILSQICLTFYQISRLKLCFSTKESSKYGYPNWLFYVLYLWGILIEIYMSIILLHPEFSIFDSFQKRIFGCVYVKTEFYNLLVMTWGTIYYGWDLLVLSLYIIKIAQFQRQKRISNDIVYKKALFILQKISLLTIMYETLSAINVLAHAVVSSNSIWGISGAVDVTISSVIVFLMIEHNDQYYVKIMRKMNSWDFCCCCKSFIEDVIDHEANTANQEDDVHDTNMDDTIHETGNISNEFLQAPTNLIVNNSELTRTHEGSTFMGIK